MPIPRSGRIIAIDWGEVRLGLALSDPTQVIASPLGALHRRPGKRFPMPAFLEHVTAHAPVGVVVGLPLTLAGDEEESARAARDLADGVASRTGLPIEMVDERMTTVRALDTVRALGGGTRGRREDVDALAATVLLQHFLEIRRNMLA